MVLADILGAIGRRWYVLMASLLMTGVAATFAISGTPPEYYARGLVLLLPPTQLADETGSGNPFLAMSPLTLTSDILVVFLQSKETSDEVLARAPDARYSAIVEPSTRGPLIAIDVTNTTPEGTLDVLDYIADKIPSSLERLQEEVGAPPVSRIESTPLTMDARAVKDSNQTVRLLIAIVVAGVAGGVVLTILVDRFLLGRVARRREAVPPEEWGDLPPGDDEAILPQPPVPPNPTSTPGQPPSTGDAPVLEQHAEPVPKR